MSADNGGPAFPATSWDREGEFLGANNGMTLRDYFAAHAPAEPQRWFVPLMETERPKFPQAIPNPTEAEAEEFNGYGEWLDLEDLKEPRAIEYVKRRDEYERTSKAWDFAFAKALLLQWPYAWADAMLKERAK